MSSINTLPDELLARILEFTIQTPDVESCISRCGIILYTTSTHLPQQSILRGSFATLGFVNKRFHRLLPAALMTHPMLHTVELELDMENWGSGPRTSIWSSNRPIVGNLFVNHLTHIDLTIDMDWSEMEVPRSLRKRFACLFVEVDKLARYPKLGSLRLHVKVWDGDGPKTLLEPLVKALVERRLRGLRLKRERKVVVTWSVGRGREKAVETQKLVIGAMA